MNNKEEFINRLKYTPLQQQVITQAKKLCKRDTFLVKTSVKLINDDIIRLNDFDDASQLFLSAWLEAFDLPETETMTIEKLRALASIEI